MAAPDSGQLSGDGWRERLVRNMDTGHLNSDTGATTGVGLLTIVLFLVT